MSPTKKSCLKRPSPSFTPSLCCNVLDKAVTSKSPTPLLASKEKRNKSLLIKKTNFGWPTSPRPKNPHKKMWISSATLKPLKPWSKKKASLTCAAVALRVTLVRRTAHLLSVRATANTTKMRRNMSGHSETCWLALNDVYFTL